MINIQNTIRNLYSKYGNTIAVTNQLMRQYKFNLPGYSTYQQKYNAVKQYVDCTLSKPQGTYIKGIQDCQNFNNYVPHTQPPMVHRIPATQAAPISQCYWSGWSSYSSCSASCGQGTQVRRRSCQGGSVGQGSCIGPQSQSTACQGSTPEYSSFGSWSQCSASCGLGIQTRVARCNCGGKNKVETKQCLGYFTSKYSSFGSWSQCSASCGNGIQTRIARSQCGGPNKIETKSCQGLAQGYLPFSSWSQCSASCGQGTQTRIAKAVCGGASKVEKKSCLMPSCCGKLNWSSWSLCSVT